MSGGSMDYVCYKVEDAAGMTHDPEFADMLRDAAKVLHDEEWWMSCDTSKETYLETLTAFKAKWFSGDRSERLKGYIDKDIEKLRGELYALIGGVPCDAEFYADKDAIAKYAAEIRELMGVSEFVRCRDCERVTIDYGDHDYREPLWCSLFRTDVSLDGFCAWGREKRSE